MTMPLPVNTGSAPDVARPQPTDPDGTVTDGWVKQMPVEPGHGWTAADDIAGADGPAPWRQC